MELFRLHAFTVSPRRTSEDDIEPEGGAVPINSELRDVIEDNIRTAQFHRRTEVDFRFGEERQNEVRELLLEFGFGEPSSAKAASSQLARRLSGAMDRRSSSCLLVLAAMREGDQRRVLLWTFPKDSAFQFQRSADGPLISVIRDVFSQSSALRKGALFEGRRIRMEFLTGRMLDLQADSTSRDVAEFWIGKFLDCQPGIHDDTGTRLLAKTVRRTYDRCKSPEAQEQLHASMVAIRNSPQRRISLQSFADRYLEGETKEMFLESIPTPEVLESIFSFRREVFDGTLKFNVFQLEGDVFVSSPFSELGKSVMVSGATRRHLKCEGEIVDEFVRSRHG